METISREEFKRLCDEIYADRFEIYEFNPGTSRIEALLWMLTGCLLSLLSITDEELQSLADSSEPDEYGDLVRKLLSTHGAPPFDAHPFLEELSKSVENDQGRHLKEGEREV